MKSSFVLSTLLLSGCVSLTTQTVTIPRIEQSIYHPVAPFERTKRSFYVRERERSLLPLINAASTSIARFSNSLTNSTDNPDAPIESVLPRKIWCVYRPWRVQA